MAPSSGESQAGPQGSRITTVFVLPDGMGDNLTESAKNFIKSYCNIQGVLVHTPLQDNGTDSDQFSVALSGSPDLVQHVQNFIMDFVRSEHERRTAKTNPIRPALRSSDMAPDCPVENPTPAGKPNTGLVAIAHDSPNTCREAVAHDSLNTGREAVAHDSLNTGREAAANIESNMGRGPRIDHDYPSSVPYEDPALLPGATGGVKMGEWGPRAEIDPEVWRSMPKQDRKRARTQMNRKYNIARGPHQTVPTNPNNPNHPRYDPTRDTRSRYRRPQGRPVRGEAPSATGFGNDGVASPTISAANNGEAALTTGPINQRMARPGSRLYEEMFDNIKRRMG